MQTAKPLSSCRVDIPDASKRRPIAVETRCKAQSYDSHVRGSGKSEPDWTCTTRNVCSRACSTAAGSQPRVWLEARTWSERSKGVLANQRYRKTPTSILQCKYIHLSSQAFNQTQVEYQELYTLQNAPYQPVQVMIPPPFMETSPHHHVM